MKSLGWQSIGFGFFQKSMYIIYKDGGGVLWVHISKNGEIALL